MPVALAIISADCVNKKCRRKATLANKLNDFWVSTCEVCAWKRITLDFDKIGAAHKADELQRKGKR